MPFINNRKNDVYDPSQFSLSTRFKATLESGETFMFNKFSCCDQCFKAIEFWLHHSKHVHGDDCVCAVTNFLVDTKTDTNFNGKKMLYAAFDSFAVPLKLDKDKYKFTLNMLFEKNLIVEKQIGSKRKRKRRYALDADTKISNKIKLTN